MRRRQNDSPSLEKYESEATSMILDLFRIDDEVAIVTGAGRGIGAASALALGECGADVVIASRTQGDLDRVADLVAAAGRRAVNKVRGQNS
jgi:7-alpha-hydroxysteroid dehydrogenase